MSAFLNFKLLANPINWVIVLVVSALTLMLLKELDSFFKVGQAASANASANLATRLPK